MVLLQPQIAHKAEVNNQSPVMWGVRAADSRNDNNNKKVAILSHASDLSLTIQISETAPALAVSAVLHADDP